MKALVIDTETNRLARFGEDATADGQPRLCSLAATLLDPAGSEQSLYSLIKPNWEWDDELHREAFDVNGLIYEQLMDEGEEIVDVLTRYDAMVDECDVIVGFSLPFDQKVIRGEQRRVGRPDRYGERPTFDVRWPCQKIIGGKWLTLSKIVEEILGEEMEGAHSADVDVAYTVKLYLHLSDMGLVVPKPQVSKETRAA